MNPTPPSPEPDLSPTLVIDLDGTLTPTDTLVESLLTIAKRRPTALFGIVAALTAGRAQFKRRVAEVATIRPADLPWREDLLQYLAQQRAQGRRLVLATAAHRSIADPVASHLKLFDDVIATADGENMKGRAKLEAIRANVSGRFTYAGDSRADLDVWNGADAAILVGVPVGVRRSVKVPIEREFPVDTTPASAWLRAMRPHQWVKNILVFVPLLTAFAFSQVDKLLAGVGAFLAFSLAASATYLLNDILDVENDRSHPRKRLRPFASGALQIHHGLVASLTLFVASAVVAAGVSTPFLGMLAAYVVITTSYSITLKRYVVLDVVTLALLYTMRVLAGSVAMGIRISPWLLAFSVFIFFSLALVKRCSELVVAEAAGKSSLKGRDYGVKDLVVLWPLGVGASLCSVVVLGLYIGSPDAASQYSSIEILWVLGLALMYWLSRLWIKTARGEMHDDPIVFALMNRGSRFVIAFMVAIVFLAHVVGSR